MGRRAALPPGALVRRGAGGSLRPQLARQHDRHHCENLHIGQSLAHFGSRSPSLRASRPRTGRGGGWWSRARANEFAATTTRSPPARTVRRGYHATGAARCRRSQDEGDWPRNRGRAGGEHPPPARHPRRLCPTCHISPLHRERREPAGHAPPVFSRDDQEPPPKRLGSIARVAFGPGGTRHQHCGLDPEPSLYRGWTPLRATLQLTQAHEKVVRVLRTAKDPGLHLADGLHHPSLAQGFEERAGMVHRARIRRLLRTGLFRRPEPGPTMGHAGRAGPGFREHHRECRIRVPQFLKDGSVDHRRVGGGPLAGCPGLLQQVRTRSSRLHQFREQYFAEPATGTRDQDAPLRRGRSVRTPEIVVKDADATKIVVREARQPPRPPLTPASRPRTARGGG